jgi:hypothetical protein
VEQSPSSCLLFLSEYKAALDGALARPDVPVFPLEVAVHLDLRLPFPDVADSHPDEESLLDAGLDAVHRACLDMVGAIPEVRCGLLAQMDVAVEKLAGHEPRLADAVPDHPDSALVVLPGLRAWVGLEERWAQLRGVAELYTPDVALSAA